LEQTTAIYKVKEATPDFNWSI